MKIQNQKNSDYSNIFNYISNILCAMFSTQRFLFLTKQIFKNPHLPLKPSNIHFSLFKPLSAFPFTSNDALDNNPAETTKTSSKDDKEVNVKYGFMGENHSNIEEPEDNSPAKPAKKSTRKPRQALNIKEDHTLKEFESLYFSPYKNALLRVVWTCYLYLQSPLEERKKVTQGSRFSYIAKELEGFSEKELDELREYLKLYSNRNKISNQRSLILLLAKDKKYGETVLKLTSQFFSPGNPDFLYYTDKEKDEAKVGEIGQRKTSMKDENRNLLKDDTEGFLLLHNQIAFYAMKAPETSASDPRLLKITQPAAVGAAQTQSDNQKSEKEIVIEKGKNLSRSILIKKRTLFVYVSRRIIATCKIYLGSSSEEKEKITEGSRFYYVHKALKGLEPMEQKLFGDFLEQYESLIKKSPLLPIKKNEPSAEWAGGEQKNVNKTRKMMIPTYSRKETVEFLRQYKRFGGVLLQMLVEFTSNENMDHEYYINSESDEPSIGKIGKRRRTTMKDETKDLLKNKMEDLKWYSLGLWYEAEEPERSTSYTLHVEEY